MRGPEGLTPGGCVVLRWSVMRWAASGWTFVLVGAFLIVRGLAVNELAAFDHDFAA
jgi:hypothetical protein